MLAVLLGLSASADEASSAPPPLPQRDLVLEWRQIDEAATTPPTPSAQTTISTNSLTTSGSASSTPSQQLRVLNGDRVTVRLNRTAPVVWVQADAVAAGNRQTPPSATVVHGLSWLETGRQLSFQPRWRSGDPAAVVAVEVESSTLDPAHAPEGQAHGRNNLPSPSHQQIATTVLAPLGQWVTIARIGGDQPMTPPGTWSTQTIRQSPRQLMQIRVIVP
jgi:hypothetical protein